MRQLEETCEAGNKYVKLQDLKKGRKNKVLRFDKRCTKYGPTIVAILTNYDIIYLPKRVSNFMYENLEVLDDLNSKTCYLIYKGQCERNPQQSKLEILPEE